MRVGSLDGKGVFYSDDGRPILKPGETLIRVVTDAYAQVIPGWGRILAGKGPVLIDGYAGKGTWYITNERMLFIRKPDSKNAKRWLMNPIEFADGVDEVLRVRHVNQAGGFDYCEVLWDDVRFYRRIRSHGRLHLMVSGIKYHMHMNPEMFQTALPLLMKKGIGHY